MHKHSLDSQGSTDGMVDYDRNSSAQQSIILTKDQQIRALVHQMPGGSGEFRIQDYGCGPGTSALTAVRPAIEAAREVSSERPVTVCHGDQPGNDWNALFALVNGPVGYQSDIKGVRTEASIGSFYEQMAAEGSVDFATCFAASHWLQHAVRLDAPNTVWFADLEGEARREMDHIARHDWELFLTLRARELKPGGFLFVSTLGSVPDASEANGAAASGRGIYRALQVVAQSMADDGTLDSEVLKGFLFSLWFQTADEARSVIENSPQLSSAFNVEKITVEPAPENPDDFFGPLVSNPEEYARTYTGYIRAFADSTLRTQLFRPSAGTQEGEDALADEFFARLNALYREHLSKYAFELWHLTVILQRR